LPRQGTEAGPRGVVRAVSFDLVGTLIRVRGSVGLQYARLAESFGLTADPHAIDSAFARALSAAPDICYAGRSRREIAGLERGFWREIVRGIFERTGAVGPGQSSTFDAYFDALFEYFSTAKPWEAYADVVPALERLRQGGLRLGLITNFDGRVFSLLEHLGLAPWFSVVAIPGVAGTSKPDPGIFRYALSRLGVEAPSALHVGDSQEEDTRAAAAAGLRGVWLDREGRGDAPEGMERIASLDELARLTFTS
jgi:putative hydrolase of the HAD superfamily